MDKREAIEKSARFGYLARGIVYVGVGLLAAMWAFGEGGAVSGSKGVVMRIGSLPGGNVMLAVLGLGLAAYAGWRGYLAINAPGEGDDDGKTVARRVGWGVSALSNGFLAFTCLQALGLGLSSGGGSGGGKQTYLAQLMQSDFGQALVVAAGLGVIGAGLKQLYVAYSKSFTKKLKLNEMDADERKWAVRIGRIGHAARGIVFPVMGGLLIQAGLAANPEKAKGVGGALREIASQAYGQTLLAVVALGLAAFGAYCMISARYRRLPI